MVPRLRNPVPEGGPFSSPLLLLAIEAILSHLRCCCIVTEIPLFHSHLLIIYSSHSSQRGLLHLPPPLHIHNCAVTTHLRGKDKVFTVVASEALQHLNPILSLIFTLLQSRWFPCSSSNKLDTFLDEDFPLLCRQYQHGFLTFIRSRTTFLSLLPFHISYQP